MQDSFNQLQAPAKAPAAFSEAYRFSVIATGIGLGAVAITEAMIIAGFSPVGVCLESEAKEWTGIIPFHRQISDLCTTRAAYAELLLVASLAMLFILGAGRWI